MEPVFVTPPPGVEADLIPFFLRCLYVGEPSKREKEKKGAAEGFVGGRGVNSLVLVLVEAERERASGGSSSLESSGNSGSAAVDSST